MRLSSPPKITAFGGVLLLITGVACGSAHINAVGRHTAELQVIRHGVLPWQQQAINEVTSHAAELAASTEVAISHLRENRNRLFVPEYRAQLATIADHSGR